MNDNSISKVHLLNVPLENDYKNTLYFNSLSGQEEYFKSRIVDTLDGSSYQRKDKIIRYPKNYDNIANVNYVMYQNTNYSNKWFYAFVTDIEYVNDECSYIHIETDVIQTWLFDYTVKPSFVEREHVSSDNVGEHTVPENLELGEYTLNGIDIYTPLNDTCVVVGLTVDPGTLENTWGEFNANKYDGIGYYIFKGLLDTEYSGGDQVTTIHNLLDRLADNGKADAVVSMFMAPRELVGWTGDGEWTTMGGGGAYRTVTANIEAYNPYRFADFDIDKPTSLNGYTPKNNKLLTAPFCYFILTNNNGGNVKYHYEDFSTKPTFKIIGTICPSCSIRAIPLNYKSMDECYNEGLNAGKFPICGWANDTYTNWLTQNGLNIGLSIAGGVGQMALGGPFGMAGGISAIASTLAQVHTQAFIPPQAEGNVNSGDIGFSYNKNNFEGYKYSIKSEYARIIDEYFSMFGYKVNRVKTPNKAHRSRWWYTKTIDVNIDGAIPMKDMQKIKDCYNNGITFWRNASEIQNYSLSNNIANIV